MSIVYSTTADSMVQNATTDGSWNDAQGGATTDGGAHNSSALNLLEGVYAGSFGSRGTNDFKCYRSYFVFDLSGESGTVDSATISIYMDNLGTSSGGSARAIIVEATALDDGVEDHGNVFSSGATWHDDISGVIVVSTTAGYHTFTMNSDGITLIQNAVGSGSVTVGLVSFYHDYSEQIPTGGGDYSKFRVWYSNTLGTALDPKMDITYAVTADNATFFGANF
tara:strand:- start:1 stop:669 length:669 start_codon:yes stop_codon:yes gene_type:complete